jgi:hypothetical protein
VIADPARSRSGIRPLRRTRPVNARQQAPFLLDFGPELAAPMTSSRIPPAHAARFYDDRGQSASASAVLPWDGAGGEVGSDAGGNGVVGGTSFPIHPLL